MDFVTICHKNDMPQMKLQARSMAMFLKEFPVDQIIVVVNDLNFATCDQYFNNHVIGKYEWLRDKVKLIDGINSLLDDDIFQKNLNRDGYVTQQKLKIKSSNYVTSKDFCILDAKNVLANPWFTNDIINSEGKFKSTFQNKITETSDQSFKKFNLDIKKYVRVKNLTPYFVPTTIVQKLASDNKLLDSWGENCSNFEEFSLMQAAMIADHTMIEDYYYHENSWRETIWTHNITNMTEEKYSKFINSQIDNDKNNIKLLMSSIHRTAFGILDEKFLKTQIEIWNSKYLIDYHELEKLVDEIKKLNPFLGAH